MVAHIRETPLEDLPGSKHMLRLVHVSSDISFWRKMHPKRSICAAFGASVSICCVVHIVSSRAVQQHQVRDRSYGPYTKVTQYLI